MSGARVLARAARLVIWDFDGVIKDSVDVKTRAFERLFERWGRDVTARVRAHHEANGGMSRFEKMPIYLAFAGEPVDAARVSALCDEFSALVRQGVVDAPWVDGAEAWLRANPYGQQFVLVSATPQGELEDILAALDLTRCFADVYGAPTTKTDGVRRALARHGVRPEAAVVIGDARADCAAAAAASVPFILRRHASNAGVFRDWAGPSVRDLAEL